MSGIEIFGAVAAGIQLSGLVIKAFLTHRTAPRQVRRLNDMLRQLEDPRSRLAEYQGDLGMLADLITQCNDILTEYGPPNDPTSWANFKWPATAERELRDLVNDLRADLTSLQLLVGSWLTPEIWPSGHAMLRTLSTELSPHSVSGELCVLRSCASRLCLTSDSLGSRRESADFAAEQPLLRCMFACMLFLARSSSTGDPN
jgi:hypothetical protein